MVSSALIHAICQILLTVSFLCRHQKCHRIIGCHHWVILAVWRHCSAWPDSFPLPLGCGEHSSFLALVLWTSTRSLSLTEWFLLKNVFLGAILQMTQLQMIQAKVKGWERAASSWLASYQSKQCSNESFEKLIWPWKTCHIFLFKLAFQSKPRLFKNRTKMFQYPLFPGLALSDKLFCSLIFCFFFPLPSCTIVLQQPGLEGTSEK